ncbi:unnamed protein product, partial [Trichogramma brassicae]
MIFFYRRCCQVCNEQDRVRKVMVACLNCIYFSELDKDSKSLSFVFNFFSAIIYKNRNAGRPESFSISLLPGCSSKIAMREGQIRFLSLFRGAHRKINTIQQCHHHFLTRSCSLKRRIEQ